MRLGVTSFDQRQTIMMKIGVLSDTHGYLDDRMFHHFDQCDEIWHAGDLGTIALADKIAAFRPFRAVYGNIDGQDVRAQFSEHARFSAEGLEVWMTHIGGYPPRYTPAMLAALRKNPPDIYVTGHSHILRIISDPTLGNLLHINPGAAGKHGFHKVRTLVRLDIDDKKISNVQVIELGKRA